MPKVQHFRDTCIGCNSCVEIAPNQWEMDEADGKSRLKSSVTKKSHSVAEICEFECVANQMAGQVCPMGIIKVLDDSGKDITQN